MPFLISPTSQCAQNSWIESAPCSRARFLLSNYLTVSSRLTFKISFELPDLYTLRLVFHFSCSINYKPIKRGHHQVVGPLFLKINQLEASTSSCFYCLCPVFCAVFFCYSWQSVTSTPLISYGTRKWTPLLVYLQLVLALVPASERLFFSGGRDQSRSDPALHLNYRWSLSFGDQIRPRFPPYFKEWTLDNIVLCSLNLYESWIHPEMAAQVMEALCPLRSFLVR